MNRLRSSSENCQWGRCLAIAPLLMGLSLVGCATSESFSRSSIDKKYPHATASNPAVKCLCVWQAAEGYDPEGKPCRGVAGQVFFFNQDNPIPVVVDGTVRAFVFDDQGPEDERSKPVTQIEIDRDTWAQQVVETQFGPAYRVFIPYSRPGYHQAELAVRLRMTPTEGPVVFSELATIGLSGHKADATAKTSEKTTDDLVASVRQEVALQQSVPPRIQSPQTSSETDSVRTKHSSYTIATIRTPITSED